MKPDRRPPEVPIAIAIGLLVFACAGLKLWIDRAAADARVDEFAASVCQPAPTPGSDLEMLEGNAEITIPPSARDIYGYTSGLRELDTWVRLDLPAADLPAFLEHARCTEPLSPTDPQSNAPGSLDPDWWQPHTAAALEECSGLHPTLYQHIWVDRTRADVARVYVFSITQSYPGVTGTPRAPTPNG